MLGRRESHSLLPRTECRNRDPQVARQDFEERVFPDPPFPEVARKHPLHFRRHKLNHTSSPKTPSARHPTPAWVRAGIGSAPSLSTAPDSTAVRGGSVLLARNALWCGRAMRQPPPHERFSTICGTTGKATPPPRHGRGPARARPERVLASSPPCPCGAGERLPRLLAPPPTPSPAAAPRGGGGGKWGRSPRSW